MMPVDVFCHDDCFHAIGWGEEPLGNLRLWSFPLRTVSWDVIIRGNFNAADSCNWVEPAKTPGEIKETARTVGFQIIDKVVHKKHQEIEISPAERFKEFMVSAGYEIKEDMDGEYLLHPVTKEVVDL